MGSAAQIDTPAEEEIRPGRWAWTVVVLAFCHASAVATFQVLNVVVEPIQAALKVSDTEYSLMQGLAVAIFASVLGIPAAAVADRGNRRRVVLIGVVIWSGASVACALSRSASELFAARMLVGVGEVFLYPAALSLIADVAPSRRLASAIGAFGSGGPLGTAFALIGGGWLVRHGDRVALAGLEGEPWRVAFLCCGIAGTLAAVLLGSVPEPGRRRVAPSAAATPGIARNLAATLLHLRRHWQLFAGVSGGMLALSYCVFATSSWAPTMLVRVHGMSYATAGPVTGVAALIGGALGAGVVGVITDRVEGNGHRDAALRVSMGIAVLFMTTMAGAVLTPWAEGAALLVCATYSLLGMPTVVGGTALQQISPPEIRAQVMAIQVLLVNLLALSLGPFTVAALTEYVFHRPASVGYALAWTDGAGALAGIVAFAASRRAFRKQRG